MSIEYAAAKKVITEGLKGLVNLRNYFINTKNFFSDREVDSIKRQLRVIYFQEDYMLHDIEALITSPHRSEAMSSLSRKMAESEFDASEAVNALLSDKVLKNLRLEFETVRLLRKVADLKMGVREAIRRLLNLGRVNTEELFEVRRMMVEINTSIDEIELILKYKGLQIVEERGRREPRSAVARGTRGSQSKKSGGGKTARSKRALTGAGIARKRTN
jgi:hypothetical protein